MKILSACQMETVKCGKDNTNLYICAAGMGGSGLIWSVTLGIVCPLAGGIVGVGWSLLTAYVCDYYNDNSQNVE